MRLGGEAFELGGVEHGLVLRFDGRGRRRRLGCAGSAPSGRRCRRPGVELRDQAVEAELGVDAPEARDVAPSVAERVRIEVDHAVVLERDELLAHQRLLVVRLQRLAQLLALDLVEVLVHALERVVVVQQGGGGLGADRGHAGDVVGGVAHQREQVAHLVDAHLEAILDLVHAEHAVAHGVPHHDVGADQLHQILVGADDHDLDVFLGGAAHRAGDQVVGLDALFLQDGDGEGVDDLGDALDLLPELGRGRGAVRLVLGVELAAEGVAPRIHGDRKH